MSLVSYVSFTNLSIKTCRIFYMKQSLLTELKEYDDDTYAEIVNDVNKGAALVREKEKLAQVVVLLCILVVVGIGVILYFRSSEIEQVQKEAAPATTKFDALFKKAEHKLTVPALLTKCKLTPSTSTEELRNKIIALRGTVQYAVIFNADPLIVLQTNDPKYYIHCYMQENTASIVQQLKKDDNILVVGKVSDNLVQVGKVSEDFVLMGSTEKQIITINLNDALISTQPTKEKP